jgi:gluconate transporter
MTILILVTAIVFLLFLITVVRLNAFMALTITALAVGLVKGMALDVLLKSIQAGIGSTLSGLILVLGFGIMLGALLAETGAAHRIAENLVRFFGEKNAKIALALTAFVVGIAMFYNAGFVVLIPLVFSIAASTGQPLVYLGIAMAAALSVTHGFLPPHPGPMGIVGIFKANVGKTLLLGLIPATFAIVVAGIILPEFLKKIVANPPKGLVEIRVFEDNEMPSFFKSIMVALSPVLLMAFGTIGELTLPSDSVLLKNLKFFGDPSVSMLIGVLLAFVFLGKIWNKDFKTRMDTLTAKSSNALSAATMILLIIAAGGAFKQVLTDSGVGKDIASMVNDLGMPPLLLGWFVATIVRIAVGSATLAGLTAAGIVQPLLVADPSVSPELMAISIGAGSLMCSHVNDTGFWMFKEYFGLSIGDTFRSWTLMETLVGIVGLISVMVMDIFI